MNLMIYMKILKICMKIPRIWKIWKTHLNVNDCSNDENCDASFRLRRLCP